MSSLKAKAAAREALLLDVDALYPTNEDVESAVKNALARYLILEKQDSELGEYHGRLADAGNYITKAVEGYKSTAYPGFLRQLLSEEEGHFKMHRYDNNDIIITLELPAVRSSAVLARMVNEQMQKVNQELVQLRGDRPESPPPLSVKGHVTQSNGEHRSKQAKAGGGRGAPSPTGKSAAAHKANAHAIGGVHATLDSNPAPNSHAALDVSSCNDLQALLDAINVVWPPRSTKETFMKGQIARHIVEQQAHSDNGRPFCTDLAKLGEGAGCCEAVAARLLLPECPFVA